MASAVLTVWACGVAGAQNAPQAAYIIGPQDVLAVAIWNQPSFSGKFPVDADGSFTYPLIGKVPVAGRTLQGVEEELTQRLKNGYLKDPQIVITIEEYRSQRVFLVGEVREPGSYPMSGPMTLIEALAKARSTTTDPAEVLIIRPANRTTGSGPVLPDQANETETIKVDLRAIHNGDLSRNIILRDGDTIFVPRAETVYVFGQVRSPGVVTISKDTTVLQVLALVGGVTDRGAPGRIRVIRTVNGKKRELKLKLEDVVRGGDTIVVPERYF